MRPYYADVEPMELPFQTLYITSNHSSISLNGKIDMFPLDIVSDLSVGDSVEQQRARRQRKARSKAKKRQSRRHGAGQRCASAMDDDSIAGSELQVQAEQKPSLRRTATFASISEEAAPATMCFRRTVTADSLALPPRFPRSTTGHRLPQPYGPLAPLAPSAPQRKASIRGEFEVKGSGFPSTSSRLRDSDPRPARRQSKVSRMNRQPRSAPDLMDFVFHQEEVLPRRSTNSSFRRNGSMDSLPHMPKRRGSGYEGVDPTRPQTMVNSRWD